MRSEITIDLAALRQNARDPAARARRRGVVGRRQGGRLRARRAVDCGRAALDAGATALCVANVPEALLLRAALPAARLVVMGPLWPGELAAAREAKLELVVSSGEIPEGVDVHLKLDTGMGRWGFSELPAPTRNVVGLMTHLATAESDSAVRARAARAVSRRDGGLAAS